MIEESPADVLLEVREGYLEARFLGVFSVTRFNDQVIQAVQACRGQNLTLLLVDITRLDANLAMHERFEIAHQGAQTAAGLKVSMLALSSQIEPRKFGILVARNRGLQVDVFMDRREAIEWLLRVDPPVPPKQTDP